MTHLRQGKGTTNCKKPFADIQTQRVRIAIRIEVIIIRITTIIITIIKLTALWCQSMSIASGPWHLPRPQPQTGNNRHFGFAGTSSGHKGSGFRVYGLGFLCRVKLFLLLLVPEKITSAESRTG